MKNFIKKIRNQKALKKMPVHNLIHNPVNNQDGSIILIAMMMLVIMTVIGLMSSDTVVTENFIIRNESIYRQNMNMVEAAMIEQFQSYMMGQLNNPVIIADTWYALDASNRILNDANSRSITTPRNLADRNEMGSGNLRVAFMAEPPPGYSLKIKSGATVTQKGKLLSEYISLAGAANHGYGMLRMEMGALREFILP